MNEDFYKELESARHNLINAVLAVDFDVDLRVASEDVIILIDQLLVARPLIVT